MILTFLAGWYVAGLSSLIAETLRGDFEVNTDGASPGAVALVRVSFIGATLVAALAGGFASDVRDALLGIRAERR